LVGNPSHFGLGPWASEGGQGGQGPLDFKTFSKKGYLLSFEWKKKNFTTFGPLVATPGKKLPTLMFGAQ